MRAEPRHRDHGMLPGFDDPMTQPPRLPDGDRFVWAVSAVLVVVVVLALILANA